MRHPWAVALLLLLPGCLGSDVKLSVLNQTDHPVHVDWWINGTSATLWSWTGTVAPGAEVQLGAFHVPFGPAYRVEAVVDHNSTALRGGLGDSYFTLVLVAGPRGPGLGGVVA